jgi:hypothetical protein
MKLSLPSIPGDFNGEPIDPSNLTNERPTVVKLKDQGEVYVADTRILDNGWVRLRLWNNRSAKIPPQQVISTVRIPTERYGERDDDGFCSKRVADEEWRQLATSNRKKDRESQQEVVADGGTQEHPPDEPEHDPATPLRIERNGDVLAVGAQLPSGTIVVEWNREAFPPEERTQYPVESRYSTEADAIEASGGAVIFEGLE